MGMFDDALHNAVPGGNLTKPLMIAAGALLLAKWLGGKSGSSQPEILPPLRTPQSMPQTAQPQTIDASVPDSAIPGGLGGLLDKLRHGGLAEAANSWVGTGPNQPVTQGQLGAALGQTTISEIAQKSGASEADILDMLKQMLPQLVDHLTPNGRVPTAQDVAASGRR